MSQVNLAAVLKIVNNLADDTAAAVRCHCCIKVNCAMGTVGACERGRNRAFERFGASLTKRRNDTDGLRFAALTEIFASASPAAADRADLRVKKRHGRLEQLKRSKGDH